MRIEIGCSLSVALLVLLSGGICLPLRAYAGRSVMLVHATSAYPWGLRYCQLVDLYASGSKA
jgi:hypothetical protein